MKIKPLGSVPASLSDGAGAPVAITVKEPCAPMLKVTALALVMAAAWPMRSVKLCVASAPTPL